MKWNFLFILVVMLSSTACKTCQKKSETSESHIGQTTGVVSHQYRSGGCPTVIVVNREEGETMVLIPKDPIPSEFDNDNTVIRFDYSTLRMPNPAGCVKGIPAALSNISKVKK